MAFIQPLFVKIIEIEIGGRIRDLREAILFA